MTSTYFYSLILIIRIFFRNGIYFTHNSLVVHKIFYIVYTFTTSPGLVNSLTLTLGWLKGDAGILSKYFWKPQKLKVFGQTTLHHIIQAGLVQPSQPSHRHADTTHKMEWNKRIRKRIRKLLENHKHLFYDFLRT